MAVEGSVAEPDQIQHHDRNIWIGFAEQLPLLVGPGHVHGDSLRMRYWTHQLISSGPEETSTALRPMPTERLFVVLTQLLAIPARVPRR